MSRCFLFKDNTNHWWHLLLKERVWFCLSPVFDSQLFTLALHISTIKDPPSRPCSNSWPLISPRTRFLFRHRLWFSHYPTLLHSHPTGKWPQLPHRHRHCHHHHTSTHTSIVLESETFVWSKRLTGHAWWENKVLWVWACALILVLVWTFVTWWGNHSGESPPTSHPLSFSNYTFLLKQWIRGHHWLLLICRQILINTDVTPVSDTSRRTSGSQ